MATPNGLYEVVRKSLKNRESAISVERKVAMAVGRERIGSRKMKCKMKNEK
jgi:hypothetical protein